MRLRSAVVLMCGQGVFMRTALISCCHSIVLLSSSGQVKRVCKSNTYYTINVKNPTSLFRNSFKKDNFELLIWHWKISSMKCNQYSKMHRFFIKNLHLTNVSAIEIVLKPRFHSVRYFLFGCAQIPFDALNFVWLVLWFFLGVWWANK